MQHFSDPLPANMGKFLIFTSGIKWNRFDAEIGAEIFPQESSECVIRNTWTQTKTSSFGGAT